MISIELASQASGRGMYMSYHYLIGGYEGSGSCAICLYFGPLWLRRVILAPYQEANCTQIEVHGNNLQEVLINVSLTERPTRAFRSL